MLCFISVKQESVCKDLQCCIYSKYSDVWGTAGFSHQPYSVFAMYTALLEKIISAFKSLKYHFYTCQLQAGLL